MQPQIRFLTIAFLVFFTCQSVQAQDTLNRLYGTYAVETGKAGIVLADSSMYAVGTSSAFFSMSSQAYLIKLDKHGDILWSKFYGGTGVDDATDMLFDVDSSIYIVCNSYNGSVKGYDVKIIKVDNDGNLLWEKAYGTNDWDVPAKIVKCDLGTYMVCGYTYGGSGGQKDGMLFKFTDAGDSLQFSSFGGPTDDEFTDLVMTATDTVAVCGISISYTGKKRGWLFEQTTSGALVSDKKYGLAYNLEFNAIALNQYANYLVGATTDSTAGGNNRLNARTYDRNTKACIYDFLLGGSSDEKCTDIRFMNGWNHLLGITKSFGLGGYDGVVFRFDDYYWCPQAATWGTSEDDFVNSFVPNMIGHFTAFGTSQELYGISDLWVVNCGSTYQGGITIDSQLDINGVTENTNTTEESAIDVYPNPVTTTIHLAGNDMAQQICIADLSGKIILTIKNANSADLSGLSKGVYLMTIEFKDKMPFTKRIIKG
ncbi:MAG TPA: T9SS type A sorting domain-containing protein [Flavobacteriales bacterium]|nr:T9SS type A sorting domain-containing protein [Flavobacteriales bacterium]